MNRLGTRTGTGIQLGCCVGSKNWTRGKTGCTVCTDSGGIVGHVTPYQALSCPIARNQTPRRTIARSAA